MSCSRRVIAEYRPMRPKDTFGRKSSIRQWGSVAEYQPMLQPADLTQESPGRLVRVQEGAWAFVPGPLPPRLNIDAKLLKRTEEAARELGLLAGVGGSLANPHLLIQPF